MSHDTSRRALAERLGILSSYLSQDGSQLRSTSDETQAAILAAMGYDASSEARARALVGELQEREAERVAQPAHVIREREVAEAENGGLRFHVPESWGVRAGGRVEYVLAVENEGGGGESRTHEDGANVGEGGYFTVALEPPANAFVLVSRQATVYRRAAQDVIARADWLPGLVEDDEQMAETRRACGHLTGQLLPTGNRGHVSLGRQLRRRDGLGLDRRIVGEGCEEPVPGHPER